MFVSFCGKSRRLLNRFEIGKGRDWHGRVMGVFPGPGIIDRDEDPAEVDKALIDTPKPLGSSLPFFIGFLQL